MGIRHGYIRTLGSRTCRTTKLLTNLMANPIIPDLVRMYLYQKKMSHPKDHWTLKTGYSEDLNTPAIQVQTLPLEGPTSLGQNTLRASGIRIDGLLDRVGWLSSTWNRPGWLVNCLENQLYIYMELKANLSDFTPVIVFFKSWLWTIYIICALSSVQIYIYMYICEYCVFI